MNRKFKRVWTRRWIALAAAIAIITFIVRLFDDDIKAALDSVLLPPLVFLVGATAKPVLHTVYPVTLFLVLLFLSRKYLEITAPNIKYFSSIDFSSPTAATLRDAVNGILKSEKTQPYFVHVAPMNEEITQLYHLLDATGLVMINGKPGLGKSMLAYNAMFRYRRKIRYFSILQIKRKCKAYTLNLERVKDKADIVPLLNELDFLPGGKNKIILVDDAHKLGIEEDLLHEFREEAYERNNGKFIWVNTNYLEAKNLEAPDIIEIEFERFYPKLLKELYESNNPVVSEEIKATCSNLNEAVNLTEKGKINDAWHFNFVATNGEERINVVLQKLSTDKEKQDLLHFILFFHSAWNIITGEKEISQTELSELLGQIEIQPFKENLKKYPLDILLSELASQNKGRFLIIRDRDVINRGYLHALHYRMSIAIIKTITTSHIREQGLIHKMLDSISYLLTLDYENARYIGVLFTALGGYRKYFLNKNAEWINGFFYNVIPEQLNVYPPFLYGIRQSDKKAYNSILNQSINSIADKISSALAKKFAANARFITAFGSDRSRLINLLDFTKLAATANRADVAQLKQVADFINALREERVKLTKHLDSKDFEQLAKTANRADVAQFAQLEAILNALRDERVKLTKLLDFEQLAKTANRADVAQLMQVAAFINALREERVKLTKLLDFEQLAKTAKLADVAQFAQLEAILSALRDERVKLTKLLDFEQLAKTAKLADVAQFAQLEAILNALRNERVKLTELLDFEQLAKTANRADVAQLKQVADFINALREERVKLTKHLDSKDFEQLAKTANRADVAQLEQVAGFIIALGGERVKLTKRLDFHQLGKTANRADVTQLRQVAVFIIALGDSKKELSQYLDSKVIIDLSPKVDYRHITPFCIIVASFAEDNQQQIVDVVDWVYLLSKIKINHKALVKSVVYVLSFHNRKSDRPSNTELETVREYMVTNAGLIIYHSTKNFILPDDYPFITNLLTLLSSYDPVLRDKIVYKLRDKIVDNFEISSKHYQYFVDLLNIIRLVNPRLCQEFINSASVRKKIGESLAEAQFDEQVTGLPNLLLAIQEVNAGFYRELLTLKEGQKN